MTKKVLVVGANGQLGRSLQKVSLDSLYMQEIKSKMKLIFVARERLDLSSSASIKKFFQDKSFDVIINCAAYTGVDKAETEFELANQINHLAVRKLAEIAKRKSTILIHISTDYVFNGKSYCPYTESDIANPNNVYGLTKLKGEQAIKEILPYGCIIRTSWVFSEFGNNFVKTMLRLGADRDKLEIIADQIGSPTYATDLAHAILILLDSKFLISNTVKNNRIQNSSFNIYNYSNQGICSWYDFAKAIFDISSVECTINPIETKDYPAPAKRPFYSVMSKTKIINDLQIQIPHWQESLKGCIKILEN